MYLLSFTSLLGAETVKVPFDLPADVLERSMKNFAAQSGLEVLIPSDAVAEIRTRAVRGKMTHRQALDVMLAGTGLAVLQDPRTGALTVVKKARDRSDQGSAQRKSDDPETGKKKIQPDMTEPARNPMKRKNPIALLGAWIALTLAPIQGSQGAEPPSGPQAHMGTVTGRVQNIVTGQYLNNARISIRGTDMVGFTDQLGFYRIVDVPSGSQVLDVFYTDLDPQEIHLEVPGGASVEQNVSLSSVARYGRDSGLVMLDPFLVASNRETDAEALAINEQRFAANIKNVVATDSMGDIVGNGVGEFLKYLPGITAEYDASEVRGISIRGIGSGMTAVESDGMSAVSADHNVGRTVNVTPMSLNQISRIEVSKVPMPSNPADSLAGSINMISKTAFERASDELRYGVNLTGNFKSLTLKRTPHNYKDNNTYKITPGYDFDYSKLIGKDFGIILTAMSTSSYAYLDFMDRTWNNAGTDTNASVRQPYLQSVLFQGSARYRNRELYGLRADWKVTPHSVLTFGARRSKSASARMGRNSITFNAGTNANPTLTNGTRMSYGPAFTQGATGRGLVTMTGTAQFGNVDGDVFDLHYRFDDGYWKINASFIHNESEARLNPDGFSSVAAILAVPIRIEYSDIGSSGAPMIRVFNNANEEVDYRDINNYRMTNAAGGVGVNQRIQYATKSGKLDLVRRLNAFRFPATIQTGGLYRHQLRDRLRPETGTLNFAGTNHPAAPYLGQVYNEHELLGFGKIPALSAWRSYQAFATDPSLFTQTTAQAVAAAAARLGNSEHAEETVSAYYLQAEAYLMDNRLRVLGGLRYEHTKIEGEGLLYDPNRVYVRNPDGSFAYNSQGQRIRKPEAGAAASLEEALYTRTERGYTAQRSYDGYYPGLHLTYNIRENLIGRLAYARTYGRPDFQNIIPNANLNEAELGEDEIDDPDVIKGTITVRNTGLKPWTADNYDLSVEYYTPQGGLFSAGVFLKEITDFFGTQVRLATPETLRELGLDSRYLGWNVSTMFNSGDARISGVEFNARQSLRQLGGWGRYFTLFANATRLRLEGNPYATFTAFVPKSANWGFSFNWKRVTLVSKWTYRGEVKSTAQPAFGPDGFQYTKAFTIMDLNATYRLSSRLSLTASISNVFDEYNGSLMRYGSETPEYARLMRVGEFGPQFSLGIKGRF